MINRMNRVGSRVEEDTSILASAVRYDADQIRSDEEKAQARSNMGAISAAQLADTKADLEEQIENISGISDPEAVSQMVTQVAQHEEDISDLKSALDAVVIVDENSPNLFDDSTYVEGYYIDNTNGNPTPYENWGYITANVEPGTYFLIGAAIGSTVYQVITDLYIGYYNAQDVFISGEVRTEQSDGKITVPQNAKIARISSHNYSLGHGSTPSRTKMMLVTTEYYASNVHSTEDYIPYSAGTGDVRIKESSLPDSVVLQADLESATNWDRPFDLIKDSYVTASGVITAYNLWDRTDFIDCSNYDYIYIECPNNVVSFPYNCFYASKDDASFISNFNVINNGIAKINVPEGANYFILSNQRSVMANIKVKGYLMSEILNSRVDEDTLDTLLRESEYMTIMAGEKELFANEVKTTIATIESHTDTPSFVMTLVADPHLLLSDPARIQRTEDTFKNINAVTRYCWSNGLSILGDMVQGNVDGMTQAEVDETIRMVMGWGQYCNSKVFGFNGNHDGIGGSIPQTDNYATMLRLNEEYVVRENGNPYFYMDYPHHKIRAFYLCTNQQIGNTHIWGMGNDQLAWFTATLASVPTNYDIVIFSHIGTFDTKDFKTNRAECCAALNDWIANASGKCIGWYCGHEHLDCIVPISASGINCPQVVLQCSLMSKWTPTAEDTYIYNLPWVSNDRTVNTVSQDCWTTLCYNKADNKVYLVRFGAGNDMTIDLSDY